MSTHRTDTPEPDENDRGDEMNGAARIKRAAATLSRYGRNDSTAMVAGGAMVVRAIRSPSRSRTRTAMRALAGAALLGVGLRQRRSKGGDGGIREMDEGKKTVSDDAHAARERSDVLHQDEQNPRGTSGEPDVETTTGADEGSIQFTDEGEETRRKPHLDERDPKDPRYDDDADGEVEIDVSESAMADEASEATGPTPEQAEPAQTEDTEPEASPPEDASHMQADEPDDGTADSGPEAVGDELEGEETAESETIGDEMVDEDEEST